MYPLAVIAALIDNVGGTAVLEARTIKGEVWIIDVGIFAHDLSDEGHSGDVWGTTACQCCHDVTNEGSMHRPVCF